MDGREFVRRARKHAKKAGRGFVYDPKRRKGSHGVLQAGRRRTTVKHGELKPGTLRSMLKQLDIPKEEF